MRYVAIGGVAVAGLFGLSVLLGSFYTIDQGERGVILKNGAVVGIAEPGLGFKIPFVYDVVKIPVTTQTWTWDKMNSLSYDQQPADLKISVTLHAEPGKVNELYARFGSLDNAVKAVVSPIVNRDTKVVFGRYTAQKTIQDRGQLNRDIKDALLNAGIDKVIEVESVQLENVEFSPVYLKSIEDRMLAEVKVQQREQDLQREKVEAQITVTKATAEADSKKKTADGEAYSTRVRGEAEADAIKVKQEALAQSPNYVSLVQAEKWNGVLPTTMVPGSAVPFVSVK
jgi:regulator of protease activity HflC (stomatin/prohibitin superfamily)